MQDGNGRGFDDPAEFENRTMEDDVVALPLSGRAAGVDQRRLLAIHSAGLAVGVSYVVVRIEYLHLIFTHKEHTTVAAVLATAGDICRRSPFDVQLTIAERLFGADAAGFFGYFHTAVFDSPLRVAAILFGYPIGEVPAVEENDGIGGRLSRLFGRGDDSRQGTIGIVYLPWMVVRAARYRYEQCGKNT